MRKFLRRLGAVLGVPAVVFAAATCSDSGVASGPAPQTQKLSVSVNAVFPTSASQAIAVYHAAGLDVDHARIVIVRPPADTLKDTTVATASAQANITIDLVTNAAAGEVLLGGYELRAGSVVLFQGHGEVTAHGANDGAAAPAPIPVNPVGAGATAASVVVAPVGGVFSTGAFVSLSVHALTAAGADIPNALVLWSVDDASVATVDASTGVLHPTATGGTVKVRATTLNGTYGEATIVFTGPAARIITVSGSGQSGEVSATLPQPFVVEVQTATGAPVPSQLVVFGTSGGGVVTPSSMTTDAGGRAQATMTASTTAGLYGFVATVGLLSTSASVTAVAGAPASIAALSGNAQSDTVQKTLKNPLVVRVTDRFSNPKGGVVVSWVRSSGAGAPTASSSTTGADGTTSIGYTFGAQPGPESLVASAAGVAAPVTFTMTASAGLPSSVTALSGSGQVAAVGSTLPIPIVIRVTDAVGTPLAAAPVTWSVQSGSATLIGVQPLTGSDGRASATVVLGAAAGAVTITATVNGHTTTFTETGTAGPATTLSVVSGGGQTAAAGTAVGQITAKVTDTQGNPVANQSVSFAVASGGGSVAVINGATDVDGLARGIWTLGALIGTQTLAVAVPGLSGSPVTLTATATSGVPPQQAVMIGFLVQPSTVAVGTAISPAVTVAALDAQSHVVTSFTGTVTIVLGSNPSAAALGGTKTRAFVSGIATFNDLTVSSSGIGYTLGASTTGLPSSTTGSNPFNVTAPAPAGSTTTWTGALSSDWSVAGNWSSGVPAAGTSVTIPAPTPNQPVLISNVSINDLVVSAGATVSIGPFTLTAAGNIDAGGGVVGSGTLISTGTGKTLRGTIANLSVSGAVSVVTGSTLTVTGSAAFPNGSFSLSGGSATVPSLLIGASAGVGTFSQTGGTLTVLGNASFGGTTRTSGLITAGTLIVAGNFKEYGATSSGFTASGTHRTILNGTASQTISIPDGQASHFNDIELAGPGPYTGGIFAVGQLISRAHPVVISGASVAGLDVDGLTVDGGPLTSTDGTIARFDNVTFRNYNPTPFTITNPGGATPFTFTNIKFVTTPVTPFHYIDAIDDNSGDGRTLTINLPNSSPADGSALTGRSGGAVVNWAGQAPPGTGGSTVNHWTNPAGGSWSTAGNWSLGHVPATADSAVIDAPGTYTVSLAAPVTASYITVGGASGTQTFAASAGTLTINNVLTVRSTGAFASSGTVAGPGTITNQGTVTLRGSTINSAFSNQGTIIVNGTSAVGGALSLFATSVLRVEPDGAPATLSVTPSFANNGSITLTSAGGAFDSQLLMPPEAVLTNASGGTITAAIGAGGNRALDVALHNLGTVVVNAPLSMSQVNVQHTNSGTINIISGNLTLKQAQTFLCCNPRFTNTGTVLLSPGRQLILNGGGFYHLAGAALGGNGGLVLNGASIQLAGSFALSSIALDHSSVDLTGAIVTAQTSLSLNTGSRVIGSGQVTNSVGHVLQLTGSEILNLINQGTVIVNGAATISGSLQTTPSSIIRVQPDATASSATLLVANSFTNDGAVELTSADGAYPARLELSAGGTLTNSATGTIATLVGAGGTRTIASPLNNQGTITIAAGAAGTLFTIGTFTNSGTINTELGGAAPGLSDLLSVNGSVLLSGGTLNVALINGFTPASGNVFPLMVYGSVSGDFATYNLPGGAAAWSKSPAPTGTGLALTKK